jgi:purine-binding chemotaxis protein CheW
MPEYVAETLGCQAGKYLTFKLANEEYGVGILKVKEIIGMMVITALPKTPDYVRGVINLRGKVVPVIDLRLKFGLIEKEYDEKTCIIVVETTEGDTRLQIGLIVDSVSEVLNVSGDDLEETPQFGVELETEFIMGMSKSNNIVRTLLDIDMVLSSKELSLIANNT